MILHGLEEATVDSINEVNLLIFLHIGVDAQRLTDLVLGELPSEFDQWNQLFVVLIFDRSVQMAANF